MNNQIRHTIVMLVYNQEDYINIALESIFNQEVLPYEVIIGDDCSTDRTQLSLQKYAQTFPNIIKLFTNTTNLGIINNFNNLIKHITGDLVTFFAGDDILKPGLFSELNRVVFAENINLNSDFVIVTNTAMLHPNGVETIWNNYKYRNCNAFKERVRYSLNYRSVGIATSIIKQVGPLISELGYHSDWIWCLSIDLIAEKHYYTPFVSSVYRLGSGVTSNSSDELLTSKLKAIELIIKKFYIHLDNKDHLYLSLETSYTQYKLTPTLKGYIRLCFLVIRNIFNVTKNNYLVSIRTLLPASFIIFLQKIKKHLML